MASVQIYQYPLPGADGNNEEYRKDKIYISFLPIVLRPIQSVLENLKNTTEWKTPFTTRETGRSKDTLDVTLDARGSFEASLPEDKVLIQLALPSSTITDTFSSSWGKTSSDDLAQSQINQSSQSNNRLERRISTVMNGVQKVYGKILPTVVLSNYESTERRSFTWNFHMIPQSREEAIMCQNIIHAFKRWSSPKGLAWDDSQQPFVVIPKISTYDGSECPLGRMLKLFPCVIESVSVQYFDNGQVITFKDGMPKSIQLTLQTKEIIFHTRTSLGNEAIPMGS